MNKKQYALMNWEQIESIVYADTSHPFSVLGLHTKKNEVLLQAFFPEAEKVYVHLHQEGEKKSKRIEMELADDIGFFVAFLTKEKFTSYTYTVEYTNAEKKNIYDPYAFEVSVDEKAAASLKRGTNEVLSDILGAKCTRINNVDGVLFTVYAPHADKISILGDFNNFREGCHLMEKNESTGIFALFIPGVEEGARYRYSIRGKSPESTDKSDPMALCQDGINSVVYKKVPVKGRTAKNHKVITNPAHLYEVDLFSLMDEKTNTCLDLLPVLIKHCKEYSYTGIQIISVSEPFSDSMDRHHIRGIYSVSERLGGPKAFAEFVEMLHEAGLSVSLDFPVTYFAAGDSGLNFFDGEALFEHVDSRVMYQPAFGGFAYDYSNGFVQSYLVSAALYFAENFKIDGLLIPDLSALLYLDYGKRDGEWIPNEYGGNLNLAGVRFIKKLNTKLMKKFPNLVKIASSDGILENVTVKSGKDSLLFDCILHHGFESGVISYLQNDPFYRSEHYFEFAILVDYAFGEDFILPFSHEASSKDYVSFLKRMPGTYEDKIKNAVLANAFMMIFPGKKLNFAGTDTFCEEAYTYGPYAVAMKENKDLAKKIKCIKDLYALYQEKNILHPEGESNKNFALIKADDPANNVLIFKREEGENTEFIIFNFSNQAIDKYSFGIPNEGKIKEIFTTDDPAYTECGVINKNAIACREIPMDGCNQSVTVRIPAMGMQIFSYRPFTEKELADIAEKKYKEKVRYVEKKKKEIIEERNRIIAAANKDADAKIKELEKILKK